MIDRYDTWVKQSKSRSIVSDLCDPTDYTVHGVLQARRLEWVAFPFSRGSSQPRESHRIGKETQADSLPAEPHGKPDTQAGRY